MIRLCIEKLARHHAVDDFDCGQEALNRFLTSYAFLNQQANAAQTYLALADHRVIGFYTLVVAEISHNDAPDRLSKGLAQHPIPLMLLARLAVSLDWQGKRIGSGLLKDAMLRTVQAAERQVGSRFRATIYHMASSLPENDSRPLPPIRSPARKRNEFRSTGWFSQLVGEVAAGQVVGG